MDAADEFSNIVDSYDAMRADLAEFRHEMRRELDVIKTRMDGMNARMDGFMTRADGERLRCEMAEGFQAVRKEIQVEMKNQTRFVLGVLVTLLVAVYFR